METAPAQFDSVLIRRLDSDDAGAWRALTARRRGAAPPSTSDDLSPTDDEVDDGHLDAPPTSGSTFGVEIGGRIVGCARVTAHRDGVWVLTTVYLDPEFRGRGLGKVLVSAALAAVPPTAIVNL